MITGNGALKISKKDAKIWFSFFAELPEEEPLGPRQQEIVYGVFSQIEQAVEERREKMLEAIPGLMAIVPGKNEATPWKPGTAASSLFVFPVLGST